MSMSNSPSFPCPIPLTVEVEGAGAVFVDLLDDAVEVLFSELVVQLPGGREGWG